MQWRWRSESHNKKTPTTVSASRINESVLVVTGCRPATIKTTVWVIMATLWLIGAGDVTGLWEFGQNP